MGVSADLVDASSALVAHSLTSASVITGTHDLELRFDGDEIYSSRQNRPYILANLLLTDQREATLVAAEVTNVYATTACEYRSFARASIYLPLVLRK